MAQEKPRKDPHLPPLSRMRRQQAQGPAYRAPRNPSATGLAVPNDFEGDLRRKRMLEEFLQDNAARIRSELEAHRLEMMGTPATPAEIRTLRRALGWDY